MWSPTFGLAVLTLTAGAVRAQTPDSARTEGEPWVLTPLTVQAVREIRSLLEVPLAVTRIAPSDVFGRTGHGLDDALGFVPGVVAQSRAGGSDVRIVIRGFGARGAGDRSNAGTSRGIRVLLDGVPETEPDGRTSFDNVDLAVIASAEVIRSNASALWGNAAGGVVSLSTLDPHAPEFWRAEVTAGGFGLRRAVLRAGGPLGGGALSASLVRTVTDGWRGHSDGARWLAALSAVGTLGPRTRLGAYAVATENAYRIPGPLTRAQADSAPEQANATYLARDERRHNRLGRLALTLEHRLGRSHAVSALVFASPKFLQRSERGTFRDFTRHHVGGSLVWRSAARLGPSVTGTWLAGVDEAYQDGAILFYSLTPQGGRGSELRTDKREGANNLGAFVQQELSFGGRLLLDVGARLDAISYFFSDFLNPRLDDSRTFRRLTPKLGATWRLSPRHSLYASLGGGVEAPAGNETDPASAPGQDPVTGLNPLLEPIRSTTAEVGAKGVAATSAGPVRALSYDVALYRTVVTNEIIPYRGGRFYFTAGRAVRTGAELGVTLHAAGGLAFQTALTLSHHRYDEYVVDSAHYGVPGALADYSGNRVVGVPDVAYALGAGWTAGGRVPLTVRLSARGSGRYFVDDANLVRVPGHAVVGLTVGLAEAVPVGRGAGVRGFVTVENLLDRRHVASAFLNPDVVAGEPVAFEPGLPRHLVVSLTLERM